jgi:NAD+ synthase (glutamine-hydrolysing)
MAVPLLVAAAQFPVSGRIGRNAGFIRRQIAEAADRGASVVQFPETALPGYPPRHLGSLEDYDWDRLALETDRIREQARSLGVRVVLGTMRRADSGRPHISLLVISDRGEIEGVYDKRRLYGAEKDLFEPGREPLVLSVGGHRAGFLICYENCFPELYAEYRDLGVRLLFHSFLNAENRRATSIRDLMIATLITRAADHGMWISASNSSRRYSPLASCIVRPDGSTVRARRNVAGIAMARFPTDDLGWTYDNRGQTPGDARNDRERV